MSIPTRSDRKSFPGHYKHVNNRAKKKPEIKQSHVLLLGPTKIRNLVLIFLGPRVPMVIQMGDLIRCCGEKCRNSQNESHPSVQHGATKQVSVECLMHQNCHCLN